MNTRVLKHPQHSLVSLLALLMIVVLLHTPALAEGEYLIGYMGVAPSKQLAHVLGFINPDGTGERYPDFGKPDQQSWVFGPQFEDGFFIVLTSYEDDNLAKVRAGEVMTRNWTYDLVCGALVEIAQKDRLSAQIRSQALLHGDKRIVMSAIINHEERLFVMDLDGSNQQEVTEAGGGFHYAMELNADKTRLACHVTGGKPSFYNPGPYSINVIDLATKKRVLVAGQPNHLYFGPKWSPDNTQLVYMDCQTDIDPNHFKAAVCVGKADGSRHSLVTPPQSHWFGTPFGSNMPEWTPDGKSVTYTRLLPNSERDMSRGGSQICTVNVATGEVTELTPAEEGRWDYRTAYSPDGKKLLFTRVLTGGTRELWMMNPDGSDPHLLTKGYQGKAADFGRWLVAPHRE